MKTTYYLRTLGATGIEKSSVAIKSSVSAEVDFISVAAESSEVAQLQSPNSMITYQEAEVLVDTIPVSVYAVEEGKLCRLDDPTCESCQ